MKTNTGNTPEQQPAEPEAAHAEPPAEPEGTKGELTPEDREKLTEVVRKERAAAKAARAAAEEAKARAAELERDALRRKVADEMGLTPQQAQFLTGETKEEMAETAERLLDAFGTKKSRWLEPKALRTGATAEKMPAVTAAELADKVLD